LGIPSFEVSVDWENGHPVVYMRGELDFGTAPILNNTLGQVIENNSIERLTLDMTEVTFLDSEGIKVLLKAHKQVSEQNGKMSIRGCNPFVMNVFEVLGLQQYMEISVF